MQLLPETWELDHVVPLFAGGSNDLGNLEVLCPNCHRLKTQEERMSTCREARKHPVSSDAFFSQFRVAP